MHGSSRISYGLGVCKVYPIIADMGVFENMTESTISVNAGQAAILDLPPIQSSPEPEVTWQTDEGPLIYSQKYTKSRGNQLIILSVDSNDQKSYRARAINTQEGKEENSAYIKLVVDGDANSSAEIAPEIIIKPEDARIVKVRARNASRLLFASCSRPGDRPDHAGLHSEREAAARAGNAVVQRRHPHRELRHRLHLQRRLEQIPDVDLRQFDPHGFVRVPSVAEVRGIPHGDGGRAGGRPGEASLRQQREEWNSGRLRFANNAAVWRRRNSDAERFLVQKLG